jgi:hypothetical protein
MQAIVAAFWRLRLGGIAARIRRKLPRASALTNEARQQGHSLFHSAQISRWALAHIPP